MLVTTYLAETIRFKFPGRLVDTDKGIVLNDEGPMRLLVCIICAVAVVGLEGCMRAYHAPESLAVSLLATDSMPTSERQPVIAEDVPANSSAETKLSLLQKADVRAAEVRDKAVQVRRKVVD